MNLLWEMPIVVRSAVPGAMPDGMNEAIAMTFVGAPDYEAAVLKGVAALQEMNLAFENILGGKIFQVPLEQWAEHITHKYDYFLENLPRQEEVPALVASGAVFLGPFLGYTRESK